MSRLFKVVRDDARKFPGKDIKLPVRGTKKAMAYDFFSNGRYEVEPGKVAKVWTDVKASMGDDECLILNVRSSMGGKFMLANTSGWIDSDYYENEKNDGNIGVFLLNISDETIVIEEGERIAQGAFFKFLVTDDDDADGVRNGGFGSTGK